MPLAVVLICTALVLYSTAIWSEKISHKLKLWMLILFCLAFTSDLIGTSIMGQQANGLQLSFHGICGFVALFIMFIHLIWAIMAIIRHGQSLVLFNRYSVWAWAIWVITFISGIPK